MDTVISERIAKLSNQTVAFVLPNHLVDALMAQLDALVA